MGSFAATGGDTTDVVSRLRGYMRNVEAFNALFPQEKVYLHLDNTGYFAGETIWFKAYVVRADKTVATDISRVLYVELVHSSGEVLKSCKVRIENGQASGCLKLDDAFLLSGFYEIRAYTRYMANWDYRGVFSRVIPVFREPEKRGDYGQKKIDLFSYKLRLPNYREQDSTFEEGIGIKFYPEGGKAVRGLPCRMAFRVSEADGTPVDTVVYLMDGEGKVEDTLATVREGCGVFRYLPDGRELISVAELAAREMPTRREIVEYRMPDGTPALREIPAPAWIAPEAAGQTPMHEALDRAREIAETLPQSVRQEHRLAAARGGHNVARNGLRTRSDIGRKLAPGDHASAHIARLNGHDIYPIGQEPDAQARQIGRESRFGRTVVVVGAPPALSGH